MTLQPRLGQLPGALTLAIISVVSGAPLKVEGTILDRSTALLVYVDIDAVPAKSLTNSVHILKRLAGGIPECAAVPSRGLHAKQNKETLFCSCATRIFIRGDGVKFKSPPRFLAISAPTRVTEKKRGLKQGGEKAVHLFIPQQREQGRHG
jgi:hypothetical protein